MKGRNLFRTMSVSNLTVFQRTFPSSFSASTWTCSSLESLCFLLGGHHANHQVTKGFFLAESEVDSDDQHENDFVKPPGQEFVVRIGCIGCLPPTSRAGFRETSSKRLVFVGKLDSTLSGSFQNLSHSTSLNSQTQKKKVDFTFGTGGEQGSARCTPSAEMFCSLFFFLKSTMPSFAKNREKEFLFLTGQYVVRHCPLRVGSTFIFSIVLCLIDCLFFVTRQHRYQLCGICPKGFWSSVGRWQIVTGTVKIEQWFEILSRIKKGHNSEFLGSFGSS